MRLAWFTLAILLFAMLPARAGHSPPTVLFRVFIQTNEGLPSTEAMPVTIPPDNEVIQVRTLPEITEEDIVAVGTDQNGLRLKLNHIGQDNLSVITAQNQGRIMVVTIDGFVIYAPIIDEQITSGELIIPRAIKPEMVQLLQAKAQDNVQRANRT